MNDWINVKAIWEIVVVGLLAGAGLPALFALGVRALGVRALGAAGSDHAGGTAIATSCFAVVLAAIGYGIYIIVVTGHK